MQTTTTPQQLERINLLAAALLTAAGAHLLLSLLGLPSLFTPSNVGITGILIITLKLVWALAAIGASGFVLYTASFMVNARSHAKSNLAARCALVLPFIGFAGLITGAALIPAGAAALFFLRKPLWMAAFDDVYIEAEAAGAGSVLAEVGTH